MRCENLDTQMSIFECGQERRNLQRRNLPFTRMESRGHNHFSVLFIVELLDPSPYCGT